MTSPVKKRVGRPPGKKAPHRPVVSGRAPEALYAELKKAAEANGRTLGEQLVWFASIGAHASKGFLDEQSAQELHRVANLMLSSFHHEGSLMAHAEGHPDWSPTEWMKDPSCYRAATLGVLTSLILAQPNYKQAHADG